MYSVSSDYLTAIGSPSRQITPLLEMFLNDDVAATTSTSDGSDASSIVKGTYRPIANTAVGSISLTATQGWRATATSASDGTISSQTVTVTYASTVTSEHIWLVGRLANYPVNFLVEMKVAGVWSTVANVVGNTSWYWFYTLGTAQNIDAVRLTVTKISTGNDKLLVYSFGLMNKVVFTSSDVMTASLIVEASSESHNPVGTITSNELDFELNNENGWFTITNGGPFSTLIKPGIKVRMHTGVLLPNGNFEYAPWGTFYITDWSAPSASVSATMVANDRLMSIMAKPAQNKLPITNTTVSGFFQYIFTSIGLTSSDYAIDSTLTMPITVAWMPDDSIGNILQSGTIAGMCAVFVGVDDKIYVKDLNTTAPSSLTLTQSDQILVFDNKQDFTSVYTSVQVSYKTPRLSDTSQLVSIPNTSLASGDTTLTIPLGQSVGNIVNVTLDPTTGSSVASYVTGISYGAISADITLHNPSASAESVTVTINGQTIEGDGATVTVIDDALYSIWPDRYLQIDSDYIQSNDAASDHANKLIKLASDPQAFYDMTVRGNPAIELLDTVTIQSASSIKTTADINAVVIRQQFTYDGSLSGSLLLRKPLS